MAWKDISRTTIENVYRSVHQRYDIKYYCYGGLIYWRMLQRHFQLLHLFVCKNSIVFTWNGSVLHEIPFKDVRKVSVRNSLFLKRTHIYLIADKKYHFVLYKNEYISTQIIGSVEKNVEGFINEIRAITNE